MRGNEVEASVNARVHHRKMSALTILRHLFVLREQARDLGDHWHPSIVHVQEVAIARCVIDGHSHRIAAILTRMCIVSGIALAYLLRRFVPRELGS